MPINRVYRRHSTEETRTPLPPKTITFKRGRKIIGRILLLIVVLSLATAGVFGYKVLSASNKISVAERSILGQLKDLLFNSDEHLEGEQEERINVLIVAIGGEGHSGENLTDTIMVASIDPTTNQVALLSIPRDLYVQVPGEEYYSKINSVHAYGEAKKKDLGPRLLGEKVTEITGLPIHYYARADFIAFKSIIDALGGVDITTTNTFFDYWHKISFPAGTERMNGERALAYVRARYIEGPEGGDFKRAARQQQVLLAIRQKVFSPTTAFDFTAMTNILNSLSENIRTDMQLWEMKRFFEIVRNIDNNIHTTVLTTGTGGVLVGGTEVLGGAPASVLKTRTGDYSEIQAIAANILNNLSSSPTPTPQESPTTSPSPSPSPQETKTEPDLSSISIEIRNGTGTTGLAATTKTSLEADGYTIDTIGNAATQDHTRTTVYALNIDQSDTVSTLAEKLSAAADTGLPAGEDKSDADILIILGSDISE